MNMKQCYTENDLVQFIYRDMEAIEYCELLFSLDDNPEMKKCYENMVTAKNDLPKVTFQPSNDSINMIMAYSQL